MLMPKKAKYRKQQRRSNWSKTVDGSQLSFGKFGIKTLEAGWISARQIEASRRAMTRYIKRGGQIWIRIFPDKPVSQRSPESRMGGGKGAVDHYVANVRPGNVMFEMDGVTEVVAREAMRLAAHKLSVKTKFMAKERD